MNDVPSPAGPSLKRWGLLHFGGVDSPYEHALRCFATQLGDDTLSCADADPTLDERRLLHAIQAGEVAGGIVTTGTLGETIPGFFIGDLPYIWESPKHAARFWKDPPGRRLVTSAERAGIRVLAIYDAGTRHVFNRLRPIGHPGEMAGMVMRTMANRYHQLWLQSLGVRTIELPSLSIRESLESGIIDGAERSFANYERLGCLDTAPFLSATRHFHLSACLVVSTAWWDYLGHSGQLHAEEAANASEIVERESYRMMDARSRWSLEQGGLAIIEPDLPAFRASAATVLDAFRREDGGAALLDAMVAT